MNKITFACSAYECKLKELDNTERSLIAHAIEATERSYAPYSDFRVGAALLLANGEMIKGCNQENIAFSVTICAERVALFTSKCKYPNIPIIKMAIAAQDESRGFTSQPITPCGCCRQALLEVEKHNGKPIRLLLYGQENILVVDGIGNLLPLAFS